MADAPELHDWKPLVDDLRTRLQSATTAAEKKVHLAQSVEGYRFPQHFPYQTEVLLAEFFDIDLNEAETEKRAILDHIRSQA